MLKNQHFLVFFIALCFTVTLYSQQQTALDPGPQVETKQIYTTEYRNTQTGSVDKLQQQQQPIQKPQQQNGQSDEYGYFNNNAWLTLGATGYAAVAGLFEENFDGSVEAWVYQTATTSTVPAIFSKGNNSNTGIFFGINNTGGSVLFLRFGTSPLTNTGGTAIPLNTWTHIAVTWAGGPGAHTVNFYVNGSQSGPANIAYTGTWNIIAADSLIIGKSQVFGSSQFQGIIDEVRYWSSPRTLAQIRDNRFVGIGDLPNSNSGNALTSSSHYTGVNDEWTFNTGSSFVDPFSNLTAYYRGGANAFYASPNGVPIPYNYVLALDGGATSWVTVPTNTAFNTTTSGSLDAWIYLNTVGTLQTICSKGTSFANHNYAFYVSAGNKLGLNIGAHNYISTGPVTFVANQWYHVTATWSGGPNFTVRLYVNGVLDYTSTFNLAMPTNTDPFIIGKYYSAIGYFNGRLDEVRAWNVELTEAQIRAYMFNSSRSGTMPGLIAAWNFDGNLINFGSTTGINGSFSTGGTNNCRFSAFSNESTTGTPSLTFEAYPTVVNRQVSPNPFPGGFAIRAPFKTITDASTTRDTIVIGGSGTVTSVELFLSASHTFAADMDIVLRAPNGQTRDIASDNGGGNDGGYLTFFVDGSTPVSNTDFFPPYSNIAGPEVAMGNMGGSSTNGLWILEITDDLGGDSGVLKGWGIRLNGTVTGIQPVTNNIPNKFNLFQNYPNPFNPVTTIKFNIAKDVNVSLAVYDILGREVRSLVNEFTKAGEYQVKFDAKNLASGTYFYKLVAGDFNDVKKLVVIK